MNRDLAESEKKIIALFIGLMTTILVLLIAACILYPIIGYIFGGLAIIQSLRILLED